MTPLRQRMIETMVVRNYSERTIECYVWWVGCFAKHFGRYLFTTLDSGLAVMR